VPFDSVNKGWTVSPPHRFRFRPARLGLSLSRTSPRRLSAGTMRCKARSEPIGKQVIPSRCPYKLSGLRAGDLPRPAFFRSELVSSALSWRRGRDPRLRVVLCSAVTPLPVRAASVQGRPSRTSAKANIRRAASMLPDRCARQRRSLAVKSSRVIATADPITDLPFKFNEGNESHSNSHGNPQPASQSSVPLV
jgi:hypothetical protein